MIYDYYKTHLRPNEQKKFILSEIIVYDELGRTTIDLRISTDNRNDLLAYLDSNSISYELVILDFDKELEANTTARPKATSDKFVYDRFNSIDDIDEWMKKLVEEFSDKRRQTLVSLVNISRSALGRQILALNITSKNRAGFKDMIVMEGGMVPHDW